MTKPNKQVTRPPAATGSGSKSDSQEMTSMSVQESTGLAEWFAAVEKAKFDGGVERHGRHHQRPAVDTTAVPASAPAISPDPLGHVRAGDPDPDPSWQDAEVSLCNALSPTVIPVPSDDGEKYTLRYACTRLPHPAQWQHIASDAVHGVVEVWNDRDVSAEDTAVLVVADLVDDGQADELVAGQWPAVDVDMSPGDRVRQGDLSSDQREALAIVLDVYDALVDLGTDLPQPMVDALCDAEAVLTPRAGA